GRHRHSDRRRQFRQPGFLTEITLPELYPSLEAALDGRAHIENRMMLRSTTIRDGKTLAHLIALNDAVITKTARSRMIELSVSVCPEECTSAAHGGSAAPRRPRPYRQRPNGLYSAHPRQRSHRRNVGGVDRIPSRNRRPVVCDRT